MIMDDNVWMREEERLSVKWNRLRQRVGGFDYVGWSGRGFY